MDKINVIVVDDSALIRDLFTEMLESSGVIHVVATAEDPIEAREKIKLHNPDVITLDIEMPKMDGITFLEKIMALRPMPVVMVSSLTTRGADIALHALEIGAVDYIAKPEMLDEAGYKQLQAELVQKIRAAARIRPTQSPRGAHVAQPKNFHGDNGRHLIAIGASTGGVEAIRAILQQLPANTPAIVITQHMPEIYTATFARRMDSLSAMRVHEAAHDQKILPGNVYIAPGGKHLEIRERSNELYCQLAGTPPVSGHRPSVDVMFTSVAKIKTRSIVAAILTGMGRDGAEGLQKIHNTGAHTLGQSEASCVVYGMPKAAKLMGAVEEELPLDALPGRLLELCKTQGASYASYGY